MAHVKDVEYLGTHRLIAEKYSQGGSVLETLKLPEHVLSDLSEIGAATNERKIAESGESAAISPHELVFGIPETRVINAAFTHAGPDGARFSTAKRGAWYAGIQFETSVAEVSFNKRRFLRNVRNERFHARQAFDYVDFLADFRGEFHHLDADEERYCLQASPIPGCYRVSQMLAEKLLFERSFGIVYRSVRDTSGTCLACFRPVLVSNLRRNGRWRITLEANGDYTETIAL